MLVNITYRKRHWDQGRGPFGASAGKMSAHVLQLPIRDSNRRLSRYQYWRTTHSRNWFDWHYGKILNSTWRLSIMVLYHKRERQMRFKPQRKASRVRVVSESPKNDLSHVTQTRTAIRFRGSNLTVNLSPQRIFWVQLDSMNRKDLYSIRHLSQFKTRLYTT